MKTFLLILLLSIISLTSCNSQTQTKIEKTTIQQSDLKEPLNYINSFFNKYKNEGVQKAIDYISSTNTSITGLDNMKNKLDSIKVQVGDLVGFEQVAQKNAGNGLVLFSYLGKYKYYPLRFTFIFYKPQNSWTLIKFDFDNNILDELEYSSKIYLAQ
jgi:hypothetical protein